MGKMNWKAVIGVSAAVLGTAFAAVSVVAHKKKGDSTFENEPEQKNPLEGKKVVFIENGEDPENADGVKGHLEVVGDSDYKESFYGKYVKRGIDIILSFGGLVVLSPVLAGIALAINIDDPGPVLFTQKRVGQNKKYFKLHKFRSMKMSTPHDVPTHQLENPEQYITRVGKFLRAHSLDELPQIWDIFIGNMSVIGPRPGLWNQDLLTAERDQYHVNDVKPGLTGWAQINGRDELEIPVKAKLDGEYVEKLGLKMDAKVFFGSIGVFVGDDSVVEGGTGTMKKDSADISIPEDTLVSVVMATYRRDQALRNALTSLAAQTYQNFQVVLVDDNDDGEWTAKVQAIVDEFKDQISIHYIVNEHNMGSAATRNRGIAEAKGQYITFLDDDDVYLPPKIEMQLKDIISSGADYGITDLYLYNENGELIDRRIRTYIKSTEAKDLMRYHLLQHMTGTDTFMFKADYLRNIGGFPGINVGDEFYLMKGAILAGGTFTYSNHCYVKAYVHSGELNGLSSGDSKVRGENALFEDKKKYYDYLTKADIRYVKMRHHAVLAFAEMRRKNMVPFVENAVQSFASAPVACVKMFLEHR
ncbi:sugar transferase [Oscillibacter sp. MSJ-31]|nr:sugar transferase [Oscillibacter sp. MSJ-31]MBU5458068.1 sugar transferase [Oscillibacter sp. MSJ-31]